MAERGKPGLAVLWLAVATVLLGWTLARALRFRRWLARTSLPAPPELRSELAAIGYGLGLARMPAVHTTTARLSPMVYWAGGHVRLVIPTFLLARLNRQALRAVLAHELAHVRRRDHVVRWIEWLACSAFWWNPVAWWARRELRAAEEASCDALGAAAIKSTPRAYATSLLRVVEVLSKPPTPATPAFATGVVRGRSSDSLERRLRILASERSSDNGPRWIRVTGAAAAVCLLPLGLVYCASDQTVPTTPEPLMPIPQTTLVVVPEERTTPEDRTTDLDKLWGADPVYAYWVFSSNGDEGPHALANAPVQPPECRLDTERSGADARDEAMAACARVLSANLRGAGSSDYRNVCVVWGSKASGWRGICEGWEQDSNARHRLRGNSSGSVLLESVVVAGSHR